jgi:O-antigen/teichoic acid export membrane protein
VSENGGPQGHDEIFWRSRVWWRRTGHTAFAVWAASGISILTTIIGARALGPAEYGAVFLALAVATLVATFLDITFTEATIFFGNRALAAGDTAGVRALLRISLKVDIGTGIVVAGVIVAAATPLADAVSQGELDPTLVQLSALAILLTTADSTAHGALGLVRRTDLRAWAIAAQAVFRLVGVIIAVNVGGAEAVALSYAAGGAAGSAVLGLLAWRVAWRRWDPEAGDNKPPATPWELVRFSFHSSVTTSVAAISGTLVPVLLGRFSGPAAVGIFRVAMFPMLVQRTASGPMRLAMFPEQAKLFADGRVNEVRRSTKAYTLIGFGLGTVGAVIGYFLLPWLIPALYSSSFEAAVEPAQILLIGAVFNFALMWRKTLLAAIGRPEIRTRLTIIQLVVTLVALLALADQGAEGAAIAVTAGNVSAGVAWLLIARGLLSEQSLLAAARRSRAAAPLADDPVDAEEEPDPAGAGRW